jgi:hypothetical protein
LPEDEEEPGLLPPTITAVREPCTIRGGGGGLLLLLLG